MPDSHEMQDRVLIDIERIKIVESGINQNVRDIFDKQSMQELRDSIRDRGLLYDLLVRKVGTEYHLIGGERRLRSIKKLISDNILCFDRQKKCKTPAKELYKRLHVKYVECDDEEALELAIADNLDRVNLSDIEKINACVRLDNEVLPNGDKRFDRKQIAKMFNNHESWVSQTISLGNLPKEALSALQDGVINRTAALQLLKTKPECILDVLNYAKRLMDDDLIGYIRKSEIEVEEAVIKVEEAQINYEVADAAYKRTPVTKRINASKVVEKANKELTSATNELREARDRISKLNSASGARNPITADVVARANDSCNARTGAPRPLSAKLMRGIRDNLEARLKDKKTKSRKEIVTILLTVDFLLGKRDSDDILSILEKIPNFN